MKVTTNLHPKPTHIADVLRTIAREEYVDDEVSELIYITANYIQKLEGQVRQFELVTLARQLLEDFCEPNELPAPLIKDGDIIWDGFPNAWSKITVTPCRDGYLVEGFGLGFPKRVECLPDKLNDVLLDVINTLRNQKPTLVQRLQHLEQFDECWVVTKEEQHHRNYHLEFSNGSTVSVQYLDEGENLRLKCIVIHNTENEPVSVEFLSLKQDEEVLVEMVRTFLGD